MTIQDGDVLAHWPAMVRVAHSVVGRHDAAEDCASAAIVQALSRDAGDVDNAEAWMVTVAKRRAIDLLRTEERTRRRDAQLAALERGAVADIAEDVVSQEQARWVDRTARQLLQPRVYRLLRLIADGIPVHEVAEELGMTSRAVENHLFRARRVMRSALAKALAVLGLLGAGVRRLANAPVTLTVTTAGAVVLLVLPYAQGTGGLAGVAPMTSDPFPAVLLTPQQALGGPPARATAQPHQAQPVRRDARPARPAPVRTVADVSGPAHARAWVTAGDSGTQESGPVDEVLACLENARVSMEHVGC